MVVLTGGRLDTWLMTQVFGPITKLLIQTFSLSNFFWSYALYLTGFAVIVQNPHAFQIWFLWTYGAIFLGWETRHFQCRLHKLEGSASLPMAHLLIRMRLQWVGLTLLDLSLGIFYHPVLVIGLGLGIQTAGVYAATFIDPPGKSLLQRAREHARQILSYRPLTPAPSRA